MVSRLRLLELPLNASQIHHQAQTKRQDDSLRDRLGITDDILDTASADTSVSPIKVMLQASREPNHVEEPGMSQ
jgi:hypothetical protein